jgi:hypothetical protein
MTYNFDTTLSLNVWIVALPIPDAIAARLAQEHVKRVVAIAAASGTGLYAGVIKSKKSRLPHVS